ncbi:MAG: hydroxymethylbilane synthase [Betaproteobacteria bacterium]|nr:hydroxymethylbilane synthase [Betaproteobacteria bacterium]
MPLTLSSPRLITIASRESRLAMWQARHIQARLTALHPGTKVEILGMTTEGDRILDRPLAEIGGKGLFIKELEHAMLEGLADLAVHSMKDVPMTMPEGFSLAAISTRETPLDAFLSPRYASLANLPAGAVIGTSSLRREATLRRRYPHITVKSLRGNLDTRLKKLDEGQYDAIILAAAGLIRLGLEERIRALLPPEISLPAPGQGALGIEVRSDRPEVAAWVAALNDEADARRVLSERAFSRALGGSCQLPLGAYAVLENGELALSGFVASVDGQAFVEGKIRGNPEDCEALGERLAEQLRKKGADAILAQLTAEPQE